MTLSRLGAGGDARDRSAPLDGSSVLKAAGRIPDKAPGDLTVQLLGLDLHDLYGLLGRDTLGVGGEVEVDLQVGGTAAAPTLRGQVRMADGRFGDFQSPFVQGRAQLRRSPARREPGPLAHRREPAPGGGPPAAGSRVDAAWRSGRSTVRSRFEPTPTASRSACSRRSRRRSRTSAARSRPTCRSRAPGADRASRERWSVKNGSMTLPGLGVRFGSVRGRRVARGRLGSFSRRGGSRAAAESSRWRARCGSRTSRGRCSTSASRPSSSAPSTCAASSPWSAPAISQLRGPVFGATLTGSLLANSGVLYFADLVNKRIIDLEDPTIADLVDTTLHPAREPRRQVPEPVPRLPSRSTTCGWRWARTSGSARAEANIQLDGRVRLSKVGARRTARSAPCNAPRGTYTLKIGPVTRDFTVTRGQVTYIGDLNAGLDIEAQPHGARACAATRSRSSPTSPARCMRRS